MADNYLITGYWGEPHVTAENDRGINAGIFGPGRWVLPVGEAFRAEYIGNNTIRMYDGKLIDNGAAAGIPAGKYVDLFIQEAGQGKKRIDLIVFQYSKDPATLIETGKFVVVQGVETFQEPEEPQLTHGDLLNPDTAFEQMPLWSVSVAGTVISAPKEVFELAASTADAREAANVAIAFATQAMTEKGVVISTTATLGTNWEGTSAPYTQTVSVAGMLATDRPHISPVYSSTVAEAIAQKGAWELVCDVDSSADALTFTCFEDKPSVAIPIQIEVIR